MKKLSAVLILLSFFILNSEERKGSIVVELKNLKVGGTVYLALFNKEDGYPDDSAKSFAGNMKKVTAAKELVTFDNIPFGTYAVSVWHDQNDNKKMEKNLIGVPMEGIGVSNNVKTVIGPPKFKDAKFVLNKDRMDISITVIY